MNHAIIFEQNRREMVTELPRAPDQCKIISVNFNDQVKQKTMATMKVRYSKLVAALEWQRAHNVLFKEMGITINAEKLAIYKDSPNILSLLSADRTIPEHAPTTTDEETKENIWF